MKKLSIFLCVTALSIFLIGCSGDSGESDNASQDSASLPGDVVNDVIESGKDFDYSTIKTYGFELSVKDAESNPIDKCSILIFDDDSGEINRSTTDQEGKAVFSVTVKRTNKSFKVELTHPAYQTKVVVIEDIEKLEKILREIFLAKKVEEVKIVDSDNDGVADDSDAFPNDPRYVGTNYNEYTIAFEDLYPNKGDADFNDLVVKLNIEEYVNGKDEVVKIVLKSKVLASGAGYSNVFGINIKGVRYMLLENPKGDLGNQWNARKTDKFVDANFHEKVIEFEQPVKRSELAPMPYDPFIVCNKVAGREVHLPFVQTDYKDKVLDSDGFPWAILVPENWEWPYETVKIYLAYPKFKEWYESKGELNKDWYLFPEKANVFPRTSGLTAYIMNISKRNMPLIGGIVLTLMIVIGAITVYNKRKTM